MMKGRKFYEMLFWATLVGVCSGVAAYAIRLADNKPHAVAIGVATGLIVFTIGAIIVALVRADTT